MGIPIIKIRRSDDRLIFIMGIPIIGETIFILRRGPTSGTTVVDIDLLHGVDQTGSCCINGLVFVVSHQNGSPLSIIDNRHCRMPRWEHPHDIIFRIIDIFYRVARSLRKRESVLRIICWCVILLKGRLNSALSRWFEVVPTLPHVYTPYLPPYPQSK